MSGIIELKVGDVDSTGAILKQNGVPIDLTGANVIFILKDAGPTRLQIDCTLGGVVNGVIVPASEGGIAIPFSAAATSTKGQYRGEFVVTLGSSVAHIPSGNNYYTITIYEAL